MKEIIELYFKCWLEKDSSKLENIFADDIVYSECYGPEYTGIEQIYLWFTDWNNKGTVLQWVIKDVVEKNETLIVEWYFECDYDGNTDGFDGVTVAKFNKENKIYSLKEFQSKSEHYYPYGERKI